MELENLLLYICSKYDKGISKARLAKTLYLADWKSSIDEGSTISDVQWIFDHYGPYSKEVIDNARASDLLTVVPYNANGGELISSNTQEVSELTDKQKEILDLVIRKTKNLSYDEFLKQIYSTYPIVTQERYSHLDLPSLAKDYIDLRSLL